MRILVVEDESILLRQMTRRVHEALPEAEIVAFDNADDAADYPEPTEDQKDRPAPTAEDMEDATVSDTEEESAADVSEKDE